LIKIGAGDNVIVTFPAGDETLAAAALLALAPITTDKVVVWQQNNQVYVAKIATS